MGKWTTTSASYLMYQNKKQIKVVKLDLTRLIKDKSNVFLFPRNDQVALLDLGHYKFKSDSLSNF